MKYCARVSVVGFKFVKVEYDAFFGCYISHCHENGIKLDVVMIEHVSKWKLENLEFKMPNSKRPRLLNSHTKNNLMNTFHLHLVHSKKVQD